MTAVLPSATQIVTAYLTQHEDLVALFANNPNAGDTITGRVVGRPYDRILSPFITARRIGGSTTTHHWIDHALMEISAWSHDRSGVSGDVEAETICRTAVAALWEMPQIDDDDLGVVTDVSDQTGPRPIPDPLTGNPRWIAEVLVTLHPPMDIAS